MRQNNTSKAKIMKKKVLGLKISVINFKIKLLLKSENYYLHNY